MAPVLICQQLLFLFANVLICQQLLFWFANSSCSYLPTAPVPNSQWLLFLFSNSSYSYLPTAPVLICQQLLFLIANGSCSYLPTSPVPICHWVLFLLVIGSCSFFPHSWVICTMHIHISKCPVHLGDGGVVIRVVCLMFRCCTCCSTWLHEASLSVDNIGQAI